jgi:hypothetical protein
MVWRACTIANALEEEIGAPQMTRGVRGIVLTAAGQIFLEHAKTILAQAQAAMDAARKAASPPKPSPGCMPVGHGAKAKDMGIAGWLFPGASG